MKTIASSPPPSTLHRIAAAAIALWCCVFCATAAPAQELVAGVFVNPPFVIRASDGQYTGMVIDLWKAVEEKLDIQSRFVEYRSLESLVRATTSGDVDVILTNFIVTHERARDLKFSYPWYDTGTRILIHEQHSSSVVDELRRTGHFKAYAGIFALICAITVGLTLFRRRYDPTFTKKWADGLSINLYELIIAAKSGRYSPIFLGWFGYVLAAVWMLFGVALIAYITSTVTSAMTTASLTQEINSVRDLPGRTVGVIAGSAEAGHIRRFLVQTVEYANIGEAVASLEKGEVDAVVSDAPALEYWVRTHPLSETQVVGALFFPNKFAFAANVRHTALIDRISIELIHLHELGAVQEIKERYFETH
jgi:ABC-type amino acid transport/signal transduction systems, periplasmic component/domain